MLRIWKFANGIAWLCTSLPLAAQGLVPNTNTPMGQAPDTQIAIPAGAGATVNDTGTAAAGPLIGFQVWQQDKYYLSSFFTFAPPESVSGQQKDFGSFLLNPPGRGTSYFFAGNLVKGFCGFGKTDCAKGGANGALAGEKSDAYFFYGAALRAGVTNTTWQNVKAGSAAGATPDSFSGTVTYLTPSFLVTSKTYKLDAGSDPGGNQYQFGASVGPSFRGIAGDLAQDKQDDFRNRPEVLGTKKKAMWGVESEFFVRMNSFRPFVRFTYFPKPGGATIANFSGSQFIFGVEVLSTIYKNTLTQK